MRDDYDKLNSLILDDIRFHKSRRFGELLTSLKVNGETVPLHDGETLQLKTGDPVVEF